jgi:flavin reductase (DIM6/NTAB) family NADH-FMN oxidoreductase RutF
MDTLTDTKIIAENLKAAMRRFPQGVTVVTTRSGNGPLGITVTSFTSISLTPPIVLVSIAKGTHYHEMFVNSKTFAVNILASDQGDVSERFAGKVPQGEDRFRGVKYHDGNSGSPLIDNALSWIECRQWKTMDAGDHTIILGEVTFCLTEREAHPLLYFNRQYATIAKLEPLAHDYENLFMGW